MAMRAEIIWGELDVVVHVSGAYNPDILDDVMARCRAEFRDALAATDESANAPVPEA